MEERQPVTESTVAADIVIIRRSALGVAPESFVFEITNFVGFDASAANPGEVYDARFHELEYYWNFDDTYTFVAPVNAINEHKSSGVSYGPMVSHTYRSAGTYKPTCSIYEISSGKSCTAQLATNTLTVGDPETLFGGVNSGNTVFMDPDNDFSEVSGLGYIEVNGGDINSVLSANILGADTTPKRLMLNRGKSYTLSTLTLGNNTGTRVPSLHIVAGPGIGAKPHITATGTIEWNDSSSTIGSKSKDFVLQNLEWQGPFDGATYTGSQVNFVRLTDYSPNILIMDGVVADGMRHGIHLQGSTQVSHRVVVVNDTTISNWQQYGLAMDNHTAVAVTGSCLRLKSDGISQAPDGLHMEAPLRFHGGERLIVTNSDIFSNSGPTNAGGGWPAYQGCIRFNTNGIEGNKGNIQATTMEGGFRVFEASTQSARTPAGMFNLLLERNYLLGSWQTSQFITTESSGLTVRNNILCRPNAKQLSGINNPSTAIAMSDAKATETNIAGPVRVYNNTLVNLMRPDSYNIGEPDYSWTGGFGGGNSFADLIVENNVQYSPNLTAQLDSDAPFFISDQFVPRMLGNKMYGEAVNTTCMTPKTGSTPLMRLDVGSAAIGDATSGLIADRDFFGNKRPQYPSRGAVEML